MLIEAKVPVEAVHTVAMDPVEDNSTRSSNLVQERLLSGFVWLFAASALQALTIHVRQERAKRFDVNTRDIDRTTVAQLAALLRSHDGQRGQAFELAVADALNCDIPHVVDPVRQALAHAGAPMQTPRAVVMGLEKVGDPLAFAQAVADAVGGRTLRTGRRGRPLRASAAVTRLLEGGTSITSSREELAFADLLVFDEDGDAVVTASVKIRISGWAMPPFPARLWIVGASSVRQADKLRADLPGRSAVALVGAEALFALTAAHESVTYGLRMIDRGVIAGAVPSLQVADLIGRTLWSRRNDPVRRSIEELQAQAFDLFDKCGGPWPGVPPVTDQTLEVFSIETTDTRDDGVVDLWTTRYGAGAGVQPHNQFFVQSA